MSNAVYILKHGQHVKKIENCPPTSIQYIDTISYRLVFNDLSDHRNFTPVALLDPSRRLSGKTAVECCSAYALSMYVSADTLKARVKKIIKTSPQFLKKVGSYYAQLDIKKSDGGCGAPNSEGHFGFFESVGFDAQKAVTKHEALEI